MLRADDVVGNHFRIVKQLARGGFGHTFLAEDTTSGKRYAVKVASDAASEAEGARLRHEAELGRKLKHENLVSVAEYGTLDDGRIYLAFEWVDGVDLKYLLARGPLPLTDALTTAAAIARALAAAHSQGVIHRDVKPANIVIPMHRSRLMYEQARLIDFGVFGFLDADSHKTVPGQIFGTPNYMSPEQIKGRPQSPAADVYGLGAVLYEMIFGCRPYEARDIVGVIEKTLSGELRFPPAPECPEDVRNFLARCLTSNPARRPQSGREAAEELRSLVGWSSSGAWPVQPARPVPRKDELPSIAGPKPKLPSYVLPGIAAVAVLVLVPATVFLVWAPAGEPRSPAAGVVLGCLIGASGIGLGFGLKAWIDRQRVELQRRIGLRPVSRKALTESLAIEVSALMELCKRVDERILASTIAILVGEYANAATSGDKQSALMNATELLDKLMGKLGPWYVRQEKLLTVTIAVLGALTGLATALRSLVGR
jgi:serine/threonine protein kinase